MPESLTEFRAAVREARTLLARLELVSHGRTANLSAEPGRSAESTALFPPGGVVRADDREPDHPLRSHEHFRPRLAGARSVRVVRLLISEMEAALVAWQRSPAPPADSEAWRERLGRLAASCTERGERARLARHWNVSSQRLYQLEQDYKRSLKEAA